MLDKLLSRPEFTEKPPVLVDVGASGRIHGPWRRLAKYAVCLAFDADDRDFGYVTDESGKYRKLVVYNCIVSDQAAERSDFYLTRSPHCSSLLQPDLSEVRHTAWGERFEVERVVQLRTVDLASVLDELKLDYVDWFKTDSQGLDLRLFKNLGETRIRRVLCAEFEPGLMSVYHGEDKLHAVLRFMDEAKTHWLSDFRVRGSQRLSPATLRRLSGSGFLRKLLHFSQKTSPGWGELVYLNRFEQPDLTLRDYLLGFVVATLHGQHGFALELAGAGKTRFPNDPDFPKMIAYARRRLWGRVLTLGFWPAIGQKLRQVFG